MHGKQLITKPVELYRGALLPHQIFKHTNGPVYHANLFWRQLGFDSLPIWCISMKWTLLTRVRASPCYVTYGARNFPGRAKQIEFKVCRSCQPWLWKRDTCIYIEEKTWSCHDESKKCNTSSQTSMFSQWGEYVWQGKHIPSWVGKEKCFDLL